MIANDSYNAISHAQQANFEQLNDKQFMQRKSQVLVSNHVHLQLAIVCDPMKKREQFAVSLRKQKTRQIVQEKRIKREKNMANMKSQEEQNSQKANPNYDGYERFRLDPGQYRKLLEEMGLDMSGINDPVSSLCRLRPLRGR